MILQLLQYAITILILLPLLLKVYQFNHFCDAWKIPGPPGLILFGNMFDLGLSIEGMIIITIIINFLYNTNNIN